MNSLINSLLRPAGTAHFTCGKADSCSGGDVCRCFFDSQNKIETNSRQPRCTSDGHKPPFRNISPLMTKTTTRYDTTVKRDAFTMCEQYFVINRLFMKLFKTSNIDTVKCCQEYFNFDLPSVLWTKRMLKCEVKFSSYLYS